MKQPSIRQQIFRRLLVSAEPVPAAVLADEILADRPSGKTQYVAKSTVRGIISQMRRDLTSHKIICTPKGYVMKRAWPTPALVRV